MNMLRDYYLLLLEEARERYTYLLLKQPLYVLFATQTRLDKKSVMYPLSFELPTLHTNAKDL